MPLQRPAGWTNGTATVPPITKLTEPAVFSTLNAPLEVFLRPNRLVILVPPDRVSIADEADKDRPSVGRPDSAAKAFEVRLDDRADRAKLDRECQFGWPLVVRGSDVQT